MSDNNNITVRELCAHMMRWAPASKVPALEALFEGYWDHADGEVEGSSLDHPGHEHLYTYGRDVAMSDTDETGRATISARTEQALRIVRHAFRTIDS